MELIVLQDNSNVQEWHTGFAHTVWGDLKYNSMLVVVTESEKLVEGLPTVGPNKENVIYVTFFTDLASKSFSTNPINRLA